MDVVDRTMTKEEYEEHVGTFRANMREALAGKRKYVINEEASFAEEAQGERQPETPGG
jgi:hypothetical protein